MLKKAAGRYTPAVPPRRKRVLEVIRRWLKRVVAGEFIESLCGIDEFWYWWRRLKVRYPLGSHDVFNYLKLRVQIINGRNSGFLSYERCSSTVPHEKDIELRTSETSSIAVQVGAKITLRYSYSDGMTPAGVAVHESWELQNNPAPLAEQNNGPARLP